MKRKISPNSKSSSPVLSSSNNTTPPPKSKKIKSSSRHTSSSSTTSIHIIPCTIWQHILSFMSIHMLRKTINSLRCTCKHDMIRFGSPLNDRFLLVTFLRHLLSLNAKNESVTIMMNQCISMLEHPVATFYNSNIFNIHNSSSNNNSDSNSGGGSDEKSSFNKREQDIKNVLNIVLNHILYRHHNNNTTAAAISTKQQQVENKNSSRYSDNKSDDSTSSASDVIVGCGDGAVCLDLSHCNNTFSSELFFQRGNHNLMLTNTLTALNISGCYQVEDNDIAPLIHLRVLNIAQCRGITGRALVRMHELEWFNMSGNRRIMDQDLMHLKRLKYLYMSESTQVTDLSLMNFTELRSLDCSYCPQVTGDSFVHLKHLLYLNMSHCYHSTGETLAPLSTHLKKLIVSHNFILEGKCLSTFSKLKYLNLFQTTITGKQIDHLKNTLECLVVEKSKASSFSNIPCNKIELIV